MVENVDDNLGRLLDRIDALGLAERTVVVFLTDNGPNGDRFNGHMRGIKASVHEGGSRVPLFVRWPGRIGAGTTVPALAAHIDLLPTLADLAGVPLPTGLALDGVSLAPALLGTGGRAPGRARSSRTTLEAPTWSLTRRPSAQTAGGWSASPAGGSCSTWPPTRPRPSTSRPSIPTSPGG